MSESRSYVRQLRKETLDDIKRVIASALMVRDSEMTLPLVRPSFGEDEIIEAIDSLLSTSLTMGAKVRQFESDFARYLGVKHAVMVNSGSSANLIAMHVISNPLTEEPLRRGDEVIVPATSWSTTVYPILDVGAIPVLVDSDARTFNIDPSEVRKAINSRTRAIMVVDLLGNPCKLDELREIAEDKGLYLIEDSCEAHGAEYRRRKTGTWGDLGTFSFFFSHHITTIEGGMVVTDVDEYAEIAKSLRAHGWIRELDKREDLARLYPNIDRRFLFHNRGFNLRPTEIQGAFGIHQIKKLDDFIEKRREIAKYWLDALGDIGAHIQLQKETESGKHVWFGFPMVVVDRAKTREGFMSFLETNRISTRPILAGNMAMQPAMSLFRHRVKGNLPISVNLHKQGLFVGIHHTLTADERAYLVRKVREFFGRT